jgi:hypothetical protein
MDIKVIDYLKAELGKLWGLFSQPCFVLPFFLPKHKKEILSF